MMTCPESRLAIDALVDGEIEREEEVLLRSHLAGCPACGRELEERRLLSETLGRAFERTRDEASPLPGERERLAERMAALPRRRAALAGRLAAAAMIVVAVGIAATAATAGRPSSEQVAVARKIREQATREAQLGRLEEEVAAELAALRAERPRESSAAMAVDAAISSIERRLAPVPPPAPAVPGTSVAISVDVNGAAVEFVQRADGTVRLAVPGRTVEAASVSELTARYADLCRRFSVEGSEGKVKVGDSAAAIDLPGRFRLHALTGTWAEDAQWEWCRDWMKRRVPEAAEMERRMKEAQERYRRAAADFALPAVSVDLERILKDVKSLTGQELRKAAERAEDRVRSLEPRVQELRDLRGRARGVRVFAETVRD